MERAAPDPQLTPSSSCLLTSSIFRPLLFSLTVFSTIPHHDRTSHAKLCCAHSTPTHLEAHKIVQNTKTEKNGDDQLCLRQSLNSMLRCGVLTSSCGRVHITPCCRTIRHFLNAIPYAVHLPCFFAITRHIY